ncbi:hypothetical protein GCM10007415_36390 [Parapedobacter pyrenivorans]|uniref:Fimbrillin-A associated anchor protein Mfa1 and Mfa2 n=1 Tax=Parapedobacter pyrenivorans TaxID=1305674 RepID=A0A917HZE6_9SPHI|nr:FimB/Mfa2 family fimbrial subunit [Parapedobacter pyrenivorans]GGG97662.1 hypothetical protein GCM10007415_36390 [Parapedobacter pyrenivorans]
MKITCLSIVSCLLVSVFLGCIKENLEICLPQPVRINFVFVPSAVCAEDSIMPNDVNRLTVFLFDQKGLFIEQVDTVSDRANDQLELSLVPAHYQFVAMAGYVDEQLRGAPFVPGVKRLQDASVSAYFEQRNGALTSAEQKLYLGNDTLTVAPDDPSQEIALVLIQRTKTLNISVDGLATDQYQIIIAGNAAQYTFEGEQVYLAGNPPVIVPIREEEGIYIGKTFINWPLKDDGDYTRFQLIDPRTGRLLVDEYFYALLEKVPGLNPDCTSDFNIDINYTTSGRLIIYINNWKVYDDGYILI